MQWITIEAVPTHEVNEEGAVRRKLNKRLIKPQINRTGHLRYVFNNPGGSTRAIYARDIVAKAFLPNPENLPYVRNIDGDLTNCRVENLMWTRGDCD